MLSVVRLGYHHVFLCEVFVCDAIDDIWCGALVSEVLPCADFLFNVSTESGAKLFIPRRHADFTK